DRRLPLRRLAIPHAHQPSAEQRQLPVDAGHQPRRPRQARHTAAAVSGPRPPATSRWASTRHRRFGRRAAQPLRPWTTLNLPSTMLPGPVAVIPTPKAMERLGHDLPDPVALTSQMSELSRQHGLPARIDHDKGRPSLAIYTDQCVAWLRPTEG